MEIEPELVAHVIRDWNQIIVDLKAWVSLVDYSNNLAPACTTSQEDCN